MGAWALLCFTTGIGVRLSTVFFSLPLALALFALRRVGGRGGDSASISRPRKRVRQRRAPPAGPGFERRPCLVLLARGSDRGAGRRASALPSDLPRPRHAHGRLRRAFSVGPQGAHHAARGQHLGARLSGSAVPPGPSQVSPAHPRRRGGGLPVRRRIQRPVRDAALSALSRCSSGGALLRPRGAREEIEAGGSRCSRCCSSPATGATGSRETEPRHSPPTPTCRSRCLPPPRWSTCFALASTVPAHLYLISALLDPLLRPDQVGGEDPLPRLRRAGPGPPRVRRGVPALSCGARWRRLPGSDSCSPSTS